MIYISINNFCPSYIIRWNFPMNNINKLFLRVNFTSKGLNKQKIIRSAFTRQFIAFTPKIKLVIYDGFFDVLVSVYFLNT